MFSMSHINNWTFRGSSSVSRILGFPFSTIETYTWGIFATFLENPNLWDHLVQHPGFKNEDKKDGGVKCFAN